jgi:hypothetical protein
MIEMLKDKLFWRDLAIVIGWYAFLYGLFALSPLFFNLWR